MSTKSILSRDEALQNSFDLQCAAHALARQGDVQDLILQSFVVLQRHAPDLADLNGSRDKDAIFILLQGYLTEMEKAAGIIAQTSQEQEPDEHRKALYRLMSYIEKAQTCKTFCDQALARAAREDREADAAAAEMLAQGGSEAAHSEAKATGGLIEFGADQSLSFEEALTMAEGLADAAGVPKLQENIIFGAIKLADEDQEDADIVCIEDHELDEVLVDSDESLDEEAAFDAAFAEYNEDEDACLTLPCVPPPPRPSTPPPLPTRTRDNDPEDDFDLDHHWFSSPPRSFQANAE